MRKIATLLFSVAVAACQTPNQDLETDTPDEVAKDDGTRPSGVYQRNEATGEQLSELMLLPDKTFIRQDAEDGTRFRGKYQFTHSTTKTYIRFFDTDGTLLDRYVYTMNGTVLHLRVDSSSSWEVMFTAAKGKAAWVEAIKTDWFDEAFDLEPTAFPRVAIEESALPSGAKTVFASMGSPDVFRFSLHGSTGYELRTANTVRLLDDNGAVVATGHGTTMFNFAWAE